MLSALHVLSQLLLKTSLWGNIFFFFLFRVAPAAYGSSQARGQIGVAAAILYHNGNTGFETHFCPTPQLVVMPDP